MNRLNLLMLTALFFGYAHFINAQTETIHPKPDQISLIETVRIWFSDIEEISETPGLNPWPIDIYGRLMFVDSESRFVVANQQNKHNSFDQYDDVFVGFLDHIYGIANTSKIVYDEMWTMVDIKYVSDKTPYERNWIIAHESFHRIQDEIGLPAANPENAHLESKDGRIFLQLELQALKQALLSQNAERRNAIKNALIFRNHRFELFENAEVEECRFEMHEGMAEYTGAVLSGNNKESLEEILALKIDQIDTTKNMKWFFAYLTGPAYGLLLDAYHSDWICKVSIQTNLAKMLQSQLEINIAQNTHNSIPEIIVKYDGNAIIEKEETLFKAKAEKRKQYLQKYSDNSTLVIPLSSQMRISFDPMNAFELEEYGTIYPGKSHISDQWGVLEADQDILLSKDWKYLKLTEPIIINDDLIQGDNWKLSLNEQWRIHKKDEGFELIKFEKDTDQQSIKKSEMYE